jgi:hypothetical protein
VSAAATENTEGPRRLRIAHVIVQPVLAWDDGEELAPGPPVQPLQVPLSALAILAAEFARQVADMEQAPPPA